MKHGDQLVAIRKIVAGNILLTSAYAFITVPNGIINGGVTSCSLILSHVLGLDVSVFSNGITVALMAFSLFAIGGAFFAKSLLSSILYMGFFTGFHLTGFSIALPLPLAALLAGVLVGVSYFLCIDADSSTAGFDIVAIAVNRWFPSTNVAVNLRIIGVGVLVAGAGVLGIASVAWGVVFTLVETGVLKVLMAWSEKRHPRKEPLVAEEIV